MGKTTEREKGMAGEKTGRVWSRAGGGGTVGGEDAEGQGVVDTCPGKIRIAVRQMCLAFINQSPKVNVLTKFRSKSKTTKERFTHFSLLARLLVSDFPTNNFV